MARVVASLTFRLPWWAKPYLFGCRIWCAVGLPLDVERAAQRIIEHSVLRVN